MSDNDEICTRIVPISFHSFFHFQKKSVKGVAKEIVRPYQNPLDKKKQWSEAGKTPIWPTPLALP